MSLSKTTSYRIIIACVLIICVTGVLLPPGLNPSQLAMLLKHEMQGVNESIR